MAATNGTNSHGASGRGPNGHGISSIETNFLVIGGGLDGASSITGLDS